jgi:hypothetical protein
VTLEERRRRITERKLDWLEELYSCWLRSEARTIYDAKDRRQAKADYMAMRETIIAERKGMK